MTFKSFDEYWDSPIHCDKYPTELQRRVAKHAWDIAIASAIEVAEDTDTVEARNSYYAQLGDASQTKSEIIENIKKLTE